MHKLLITLKKKKYQRCNEALFAIHKEGTKGHCKSNKFFKVPDLIQIKRGVKGYCLPFQQGFISQLTWLKNRQGREQDPELIYIHIAPPKE